MKAGKQEITEKYLELKRVRNEKFTKKEAEEDFKDAINAIKELLKEGNDVAIMEFGTFEIRETKAREGKNPRTKEPINIPAGHKVAFKPSKKLKELV